MTLVGQIQETQGYKTYTSELFEKAAEAIKSKEELLTMQAEELKKHVKDMESLTLTIAKLNQEVQDYKNQQPEVIYKTTTIIERRYCIIS